MTISEPIIVDVENFKRSPVEIFNSAEGRPVEVRDGEDSVFVCISSQDYEAIMDVLEDIELASLVKERVNEPLVDVDLSQYL